jgi:hypothetical protein
VLVAVVGALFYIVYRAIKSMRSSTIHADLVEERESLDAGGLFGAQLRGLLAGLRRAPGQPEEALEAGSVRTIYRDVLRAAAAAELPRSPSETPDEYRERLEQARGAAVQSGGTAGHGPDIDAAKDDLADLTTAYDRERYGGQTPPEAERRGLHTRAQHIIAWLRARVRSAT